jgi:hypothetical protein
VQRLYEVPVDRVHCDTSGELGGDLTLLYRHTDAKATAAGTYRAGVLHADALYAPVVAAARAAGRRSLRLWLRGADAVAAEADSIGTEVGHDELLLEAHDVRLSYQHLLVFDEPPTPDALHYLDRMNGRLLPGAVTVQVLPGVAATCVLVVADTPPAGDLSWAWQWCDAMLSTDAQVAGFRPRSYQGRPVLSPTGEPVMGVGRRAG